MKRIRMARVTAGAIAFVLAFGSPPAPSRATPPQPGEVILPERLTCFGEYHRAGVRNDRIVIEPVGDPTVVRVRTSVGWGAVGYLDGDRFEGVLRPADLQGARLPGPIGRLSFRVQPDRSVQAVLETGGDERDELWIPFPRGPQDETGFMDDLPEAILKPAPIYPPAARRARIEGTVMLQVLVGKDGRVREAKVLNSIPELDAAAVTAVKQWTFRPALSNGRPIEVTVAVPVRFRLK